MKNSKKHQLIEKLLNKNFAKKAKNNGKCEEGKCSEGNCAGNE